MNRRTYIVLTVLGSIATLFLLAGPPMREWVRLHKIDAQKSTTIQGGPSTIDTNYWQTNDATYYFTNVGNFHYSPNTNFITFASNRVHIEIGEGYHKISLYKFTDDEWNLLTNYWREYVVTNSLPYSYGGPIDHAPK